MNDLTGKTALVTGSSRGIGRAIAIGLAQSGADITINYVNDYENAKKAASEIEVLGRKATLIQQNLCEADCAENIFSQLDGGVDILVLNASVQIKKKWEDIQLSDFQEQINCNLLASLLMIQRAVPYMRKRGFGRIITVGSVQEAKPHPDMLVYSASKAAQTNMAKSLALQLAGDGITVNNVAPGVILTDRNTEALSDKSYYQTVLSTIPAGFCGEPADCAGVVRLLCSDDARYITGQSIYVDGGKGIL